MNTTRFTSLARTFTLALVAAAALGATSSAHAGSLLDSLRSSAVSGERNTHAPTAVAAVRG